MFRLLKISITFILHLLNFVIISVIEVSLTVDNKTSITEIITKFNQCNINVIDILSKRNKLEELFIELTQK